MLLGHVKFSIINMRRDRIKNSFQKDLHSFCEAGNPPTTLLLGDDLPKKIWEAKESSNLTSPSLSQLPRYTGHQNQKGGHPSKELFSIPGQQADSTIPPRIPNSRTYRN